MARKKFWLGSQGPFFYDTEKVRQDGTFHGIQFEEPPIIGGDTAATNSDVLANAGTQIINGMVDQGITITAISPLTVTSVDGVITISTSGFTGSFSVSSANVGMVLDLTYLEGVLQTIVERAI
jgi:hypothetical protein